MDSPQGRERAGGKALYAQREAIDARGPIALKARGLRSARIRFQGDLAVRSEGEAGSDALDDRPDCFWLQHARRAPAEEEAGNRGRWWAEVLKIPGEIGKDTAKVIRFRQVVPALMGVKVAIGAFAYTPWDVDINGRRQGGRVHDLRGRSAS